MKQESILTLPPPTPERSNTTCKHIATDFPGLELYGREIHINTYTAMFDAARTEHVGPVADNYTFA